MHLLARPRRIMMIYHEYMIIIFIYICIYCIWSAGDQYAAQLPFLKIVGVPAHLFIVLDVL